MRLTFVQSEHDNTTAWRLDASWSEAAQLLTTHRRLPAKGDLAVVFARFVDGPCRRKTRTGTCTKYCPGNDHRIDENVETVTALGLDFDDAPAERLTALMGDLCARGLRFLAYTTWSSTPEHPKIRIVIALESEIPAASFKGFWNATIDELHIRDIVDKSCCNPGRLFFTPQCAEGATPMAQAYEGAPLATAAILARVTPDTPIVSNPSTPPIPGALTLETALAQWQPGVQVTGNGAERYADVECPWADEHSDGRRDARAFDFNGMLGFKCLHSHCAGRDWHSFRQFYEPDHTPTVPRLDDHVDVFGDPAPVPQHPGVLVGYHDHAAAVPVRRYTTGIPELDAKLGGGVSTRQLAVILAPPGDGKSALAVSISLHVQTTIPVLYASTELETDELEARIAAQIIGCAWRDIVDGKVDHARVTGVLRGLRIFVIGCERLPMGELALQTIDAEIARITAEYGVPPMCVIDYLQDLARGADERSVRGKIGGLATITRAMSQRLDCPMLVISSVSRTYYGMKRAAELRAAEDATAYLAAAKESGDVDYAAAVVLFLDVVGSEPGAAFRCARVAVAKSRHGETGFVGARFTGATGKWQAAPDEVLEAAGKRDAARRGAEHDTVDLRVLSAIKQAGLAHEFYTPKAWRTRAADGLMGDLTDNAVREALSRLVGAGRLVYQQQHPEHPGKLAPGGGVYIVARNP